MGLCEALQLKLMMMEWGGARESAPVTLVVPGRPNCQDLALESVVLPPHHRHNHSCY